MSPRRAVTVIGLILVAGSSLSGCDLLSDTVEVIPTEEATRLRARLASAQVHRGGIQRFALHHLTDNVEVRVENASTPGQTDRLIVTIYEVEPATRKFVLEDGKPKVLEVHRDLSNATLSQIESNYVLFYYLYDS